MLFYYFLCVDCLLFVLIFLCLFCIVFLGCVQCFCCFLLMCFIFILNFYRNRRNNITMKFQDTSCPPLAVSVLSVSVEPPSQSLTVSVSSSLDATVMTRRSTWSSVGAL